MRTTSDSFKDLEEHLYKIGLPSRDESYSELEITNIEEKYGIVFPDMYKYFVLKYGSSTFEHDIIYQSQEAFPFTDKSGSSVFGSFFGFDGDLDDIANRIKQYYDRIPSSIIPIADDGKGNLICIGVKGEYREKIYFWDHENELIANVMLNEKQFNNVSVDDYWDNIFLISESFYDFIKNLKIEEVNEAPDVELKIVNEKMSANFMANMLAARAELEAEEKAKKDKKKGKK